MYAHPGRALIRLVSIAGLVAWVQACADPPDPIPPVNPTTPVEVEPTPLAPARPSRAPRPDAAPRADARLDALLAQVGGKHAPLELPCREQTCALDRTFAALDRLADGEKSQVRLLLLGDSHIAADYIAKTARAELQRVFGDAGRGYIHGDQHADYGGRRRERRLFKKERMVDVGEVQKKFGFSGFGIQAVRGGAWAEFVLDRETHVALFAEPGSGTLDLLADSRRVGQLTLSSTTPGTLRADAEVPVSARTLKVVASEPGARFYGVSYERGPGLLLDAVGPVGADAHTYITTEPIAFQTHVARLNPTTVMLMLGGNDALRVRKGLDDLPGVERDLRALVGRLKAGAPGADCLLFGPMDAGDKVGKGIVPKTLIPEMRDLLRRLAESEGCAYWDMLAFMGESGAVVRWSKAKIMNADLIHPRAKAGELLGHGFAQAFLEAYASPR